MSTDYVRNNVSDLEEETLGTSMPTVNPAIKFADIRIPNFLKTTTTAQTLGEYLRFEKMGELFTEIIINASPVETEGVLEPAVYGRRIKVLYNVLSCFTGDIALVTPNEIIKSYNPKLPYVEKVRYTRESKGKEGYWLEWNRIRGEYVKSGRKQFGVDERTRVSGIRLPQTVINDLDALSNMLITGFSIKVGIQNEANLAEWLYGLISEGKTVEEFLKERQERYNAKNLNKTVQADVKKSGEVDNYGMAIVDNVMIDIELIPDGTYVLHTRGAMDQNFTLDKSSKDSKNRMRLFARAGGYFSTK